MSDKPLSKQNRAELVATAEGLGIPAIAEDQTKADIVALIEKQQAAAASDPADPGTQPDPAGDPPSPANPDEAAALADPPADPDAQADDPPAPADIPAQDVSDIDDESGLVTITRPILEFAGNGDWVDPFSGLRVHQNSTVCTQSGAERVDDQAVVRVTAERAAELGA